ncbi:hypothetical protein BN14_10197 [Rhizoctonia solani AG-1 IB]|uniref:Uncharacterized protein n=2 Tax=Thanatephorus cucumeris (strain AG1-IB / isolate 7/3/14) TaxID=1108050 RepID=M5CAI4_THACB|nr:hypothetical protein BN14_10197 [Rhizoctonia solani AG-1 IB]
MGTLNDAMNVIMSSSSTSMEQGDDKAIDELYTTILDAAFNKLEANQASKRKMKDVLETIICAMEPMTLRALASVVGLDGSEQVDKLLMPLRSVVNVAKETGLVTTLHASFPDFMLSSNRSVDFYCQPQRRHATMAEACLRLIDGAPSSFNICALPSSYLLDSEVEDLDMRVSKSIPVDLIYACRHWSAHLDRGEYRIELVEPVGRFFSSRLLLWMEIINLTKHMRHGTSIIQTAENWCSEKSAPAELTRLARDASQFVSVYANHPVSQSTPHIYVSMLPFWPRSRPVSASYIPKTSGLVQAAGTAIDRRQLVLIATWKVSAYGIRSFGLSADGTRLAAPTGNSIGVYSTTTGESVLSLTDERTRGVWYVSMSPDSTRVAFVGTDRIAYLWDIANEGKVSQLPPDGTSGVSSIAFSPDGSHVACGTASGDIYMRELQQQVSSTVLLRGHTSYVLSVAFSPDSSHLASGSTDKAVRVWEVRTGQPAGEAFEGHTGFVQSVSYSHDGSRLASASDDRTIQVWSPQTGQTVLGPLTGHSGDILSMTFSPNSTLIASASRDKTIRVYDARTGQTVLGPLEGHTDEVKCVRFSSDSTRLYSCSDDGTVRVWNMQDLDSSNPPFSGPLALKSIYSIRYSPSGARAVSGSSDGSVHVWDVRTGALVLGPLSGHDQYVVFVDYSPSDQYIVSGSIDGTLRIWDASTGKDIHGPMDAHIGLVRCVRFSPDSLVVVSGSVDRTVQLWNVATGQHVMKLLEGDDWILSVGFSPDGHKVVCGSRKMHVVDRYTGNAVIEPITGHRSGIRSVEFSPDGKRLVSGSSDKTVRIWDAQTGKQLVVCGHNHASHSDDVNSVGFSPNGLFVVSGSGDRTVCVWDAQNGNLILGPLRGHTNDVNCVEFSPDGSHIVSCSDDATIRFWDATSCARAIQANTSTSAAAKASHTPSPNSDSTHDSWLVDDDGWAVDSHNRRLVWVPSDLRDSLLLPPNFLTIPTSGYYELGFEGANVGEKWADCYGP